MATQPTDTTKPRLRTLSDELGVIAQRAQAFTNASGTAIALNEGNADEIVCRARSGSAAPEVGAVLRVEGSFTGLCIQTGKELRCDDAETDTRVDTAAIRALGIRSMVVTPIRDDNKVVGVLACFAPTAHAFTITHVAVLKTMADQISVLLQKERRPKDESSQAEPPVAMPKPVASAPTPLPPPVVIKSSGSATAAAAVRGPAVTKVEPIKTDVAAPVPFPRREEKQKPEIKASFGTFDSVAAEDKKSGGNPRMILGAVAVLALAAVAVFFVMKRKPSTVVPVQQAQVTNAPANSQQAQSTEASPSTPAVTSAESSPSNQHFAAEGNHAGAKPVSVTDNKKKDSKPEHVAAAEEKKTAEPEKAEKPAPTPVAITTGGPSRLSASAAVPQDVQISPTLSMSSGSNTLSNLARPVSSGAPSVAPVAQSELEPMHVLKTVPPMYPPIARIRRLSGDVLVQVTVGKDGKVRNPQFISGQPVFRDAAFDAVKQWKFKPAMLNGQPIDQTTQIKMAFRP
ncbi:MAG TPA: TonB family protein [Candidatus Angelobacter sp.]|nr:TonB family protein [Candidatus Angelobacter sp.]